jgi:NADH-quinone oxidoreductase subunit M
VILGVYPKPVLDRIEPAVERLVAHVEEHTDYRQPVPTVAEPGSATTAGGTHK